MKYKPELKIGDKVILLHMEGEFMSPGLKGIVTDVMLDPISENEGSKIYSVKWENGNSNSLIEDTDFWSLDNETINENKDLDKWFIDNIDVLKYFNINMINEFLMKLRESTIINMFESAPFLYLGKERIAHEFYYDRPKNNQDFEEILEMADDVQSDLINGTINYMEDNDMSLDSDDINRLIKIFARKLVEMYIKLRS